MTVPVRRGKFNDYASMFMEHIRRSFVGSVCRVDIVLDMYRLGSLKTTTKRKNVRGQRNELRAERSYLQTGQSSCERMTTRQNYSTC